MVQDDRKRVLNMLAEGKISADEAERLLDVLSREPGPRRPDISGIETVIEEKIEQATDLVSRAAERVSVEIEASLDGPGSKSHEHTFKVGDSPRLIVDNLSGRVEITGEGRDGEIRVETELKHPDRVDYQAVQDGDTVRVEIKPGGKRSFLGWLFLNRGANIRVTVPHKTTVEARNRNGRAIIRKVDGDGSVRTTNGRVEAELVSGTFDLGTTNGRIEAQRLNGNFRIKSTNGRIMVSEAIGTFNAETTNAAVRFEGELVPGGDSRLKTTNGSITATLSGEPSVKITADTTNGSVRCHRPMSVMGSQSKRHVEGTIGSGDANLALKTTNGSVTIE